AERELSRLCDAILSHNRRIRLRADDSVMDFHEGRPYMIRRSRGYAPLPYMMTKAFKGYVLAIGGELKNTFCYGVNGLLYPSAYVGDLADLRTIQALEESIERMGTLLETKPQLIACDLHPKYNATLVAEKLAREKQIDLLTIQHHYAHIASCMAENDRTDPVIGVSFDGTGYGEDQTIWGGEIMTCDLKGYRRRASIFPFLQLGGDASSKEGWRIAVSMIYGLAQKGIFTDPDEGDPKAVTAGIASLLKLTDDTTLRAQFMMYDRKINAITSTSAGRLFDGVSALLGIRRCSTYEGEASTALMNRALAMEEQKAREETLKALRERYAIFAKTFRREESGDLFRLPTDLLVAFLVKERVEYVTGQGPKAGPYGARDENALALSDLFHRELATMIAEGCDRIGRESGLKTVALSGGCFQNRLLLKLVQHALSDKGYDVLTHSLVPPNDGGIALGQALIALEKIREKE
ncbi:MAG: carbamoyltransferase HypF, partial [Lachnospiraceae bacterium]|nr:carbamoyltransferase HypF [Lachnospiraceae bacterium]